MEGTYLVVSLPLAWHGPMLVEFASCSLSLIWPLDLLLWTAYRRLKPILTFSAIRFTSLLSPNLEGEYGLVFVIVTSIP